MNFFPKRLVRLRTILLVALLSVLLMPLGSLYFFRFYENELVRKTELELISQAAVISATYRALLREQPNYDPQRLGIGIPPLSSITQDRAYSPTTSLKPESPNLYFSYTSNQKYTPIVPTVDLSTDDILPRREDALPATSQPTTEALIVGDKMRLLLRETQKITLSGMRILDAQGVVISGRSENGMSLKHIYEVQQALKGQYTSVIRERISDEPTPPLASISRGTGIRLFVTLPIIDRQHIIGAVYLSRTPQNILKHLYAIKERVILLGLVLLGITALLANFLSSRLSQPIKSLINQSKKVTKGELDTIQLIKQPGTYELAQLSENFATMSQTLHERSNYIKQFAAHVSHEFKTPLTSMQGAIELLQEHIADMPDDQRDKFLNNLHNDTQRLKQLVTRLLELAKADALTPSEEESQLCDLLTHLQPQYKDKGLDILFNENECNVLLEIDKQSLDSIFGNLFTNSLQHGATSVEVTVTHNRILVKDNGKGISHANKDKIFTPFFTTRRNEGGTGLGLGIIVSLLKHWNVTLDLCPSSQDNRDQNTHNQGACFVITFKQPLKNET